MPQIDSPPDSPTKASGPRWRLMMFDRPIGPWRDKLADAQADAIESGNADRDEHSGQVFYTVPAWLERQDRR